jgi:hypothetical protein
MMVLPEAWLPAPALFDGILTDRVTGVVYAWRKRWLSTPGKASVRLQAGVKLATSRAGWASACGGLQIVAGQQGQLRLAAGMLGLRRTRAKAASADLALMDRLSGEAISNLIGMLAGIFQTQPKAERLKRIPTEDFHEISIAMQFAVSTPAGRLVDVHVTPDAAVSGRKAQIASRRAPSPLGRRQDAVRRQTVRIGAFAGAGEIGLAELRTLAVGDVLVLDRMIDESFDLTLNDRRMTHRDLDIRRDGRSLLVQSTNSGRGGVT